MDSSWIEKIAPFLALVGVVVGAMLNAMWNRRSAKLQPKTVGRAEAYRDFATHILTSPIVDAEPQRAAAGLNAVVARLIVFGEVEPVKRAGNFLLNDGTLNSPQACKDLAQVVKTMRELVHDR